MKERIDRELMLLKTRFPCMDYREDSRWVLLPDYGVPTKVWSATQVHICFPIPPAYPGQKPYGFYVQLPFELTTGEPIQNATASDEPPYDGAWLKFSWDLPEWKAAEEPQAGSNLLNWALSFRQRLEEGS